MTPTSIPTPISSDKLDALSQSACEWLKKLIATPSLSKEEDKTAEIISQFFDSCHIPHHRKGNNVFAFNRHFDASQKTIWLNSHHDTVKPNAGYSMDPFKPIEKEGKLFGLGSNDAGGCLVSLLQTFVYFYEKQLPCNLVMAATAEEEISGEGGIASIIDDLPLPEFALVGEPTQMQMAVAEKGLMVLDVYAHGQSGHAARDVGENAIYKALPDIEWFRTYQFTKISATLGPVKMTVTQIASGYQHNVIPDACHVVVDVRTTDCYSNQEVLDIIARHVKSQVKARSTRLNPSGLPDDMLISQVAGQLGIGKFGSPTLSDQAQIPYPSFKMGPGLSERSHSADEYICLSEIREGIAKYIHLLDTYFQTKKP